MLRGLLVAMIAIVPPVVRPALAQTTPDKPAADAAFAEGKRLVADGQIEAACARFEESLLLKSQLGTRLNLADCYERAGRLVEAGAQFAEAEAAAMRAGDARLAFIRARRAALSNLIPILTIELSDIVMGLAVELDGDPVLLSELGSPTDVDPGKHSVTATAPGYLAWSTTVDVAVGSRHSITIPALAPAPKAPATRTTARIARPPARRPVNRSIDRGQFRRRLAVGVGIGGAAVVAVGLLFGEAARDAWGDAADGHCNRDGVCDQVGYDRGQDAHSRATTANVLVGVGAAAISIGTVLYLTAPRRNAESIHVMPAVGSGSVGIAVSRNF